MSFVFGHNSYIRCWLSAVSCWLLVIACWLSAIACLLSVVENWLLDADCRLSDISYCISSHFFSIQNSCWSGASCLYFSINLANELGLLLCSHERITNKELKLHFRMITINKSKGNCKFIIKIFVIVNLY